MNYPRTPGQRRLPLANFAPRAPFAVIFALLLVGLRAVPVRAAPQDAPVPALPLHLAYDLSVADLASHKLGVRITLDNPPPGPISFAIPAWTPGYYQILAYQKDIEAVTAADETGKPLPLTRASERVWTIAPDAAPDAPPAHRIVVSYRVNANDTGQGFFGSVLNGAERQGYVNGASTFLYLVGHTDAPVSLAVALPARWRLATPLDPQTPAASTATPATSDTTRADKANSDANVAAPDATAKPNPAPQSVQPAAEPTKFTARSYDEMIDCPLQIGQFADTEFTTDGVPFRIVIAGHSSVDKPRLASVVSRIVHAGIALFGAAPFRRYVFFYHVGGGGFSGGLEHRSSTVIHLNESLGDGRGEGFQTVTAHEFFHAWNVKRLRPAGLGPFDYTQPVRTTSLWWAEGVTDYYAQLLLVRAGLRDRAWFLDDMNDRIAQLDATPARRRVSLAEASQRAWEGGSQGFGGLSYYLKGSLVGFYFDLRIRELTNGRRSLDDAMRELDVKYGRRDIGYPETALLDALNVASGSDLREEYDRYVRGYDDFDWGGVMNAVGLLLVRAPVPFLGVALTSPPDDAKSDDAGPVIVQEVEAGFSAAKMGLKPGDRIVRINQAPVTLASFSPILRAAPTDRPLVLDIERDGQPRTLEGKVGVQFTRQHSLTARPDAQVSAFARRLRDQLFAANPKA